MSMVIFDVMITACFLFYGYKFLKNTPKYGTKEGIGTKYTKQSREAWELGHKFGGVLILVYGIITGILTAVAYFLLKNDPPQWYQFMTMGVELVLIASIIPAINIRVKARFGAPADGKK